MKNKRNGTNHGKEAALGELEKLSRVLDSDPDVIYGMPEDDIRSELQEFGLDFDKAVPKMPYAPDRDTKQATTPPRSRSSSPKSKHLRERECFHREGGAEGDFYNGIFYVQALNRLRVDDAVKMAAKVESFFWSDAPYILVWLCRDCAAEVGLLNLHSIVEEIRDRRA